MAGAPTYIDETDRVIAAGHYRYNDIKNRAGIAIDGQILVEHDADGVHTRRSTALVGELDTYTGDGQTYQQISLSNSNLVPMYYITWADGDGGSEWIAVYSTAGFYRLVSSQGAVMGYSGAGGNIYAFLGPDGIGNSENANGTTYYYMVIGYDTETPPTGSAGSDPDWVEDGEAGFGDLSGTYAANKVEYTIETEFMDEHNADGTHSTDPYDGYPIIENNYYYGDGTSNRVITLANTYTTIKKILLYQRSSGSGDEAMTYIDSMSAGYVKYEGSNLQSGHITAVGTTSFTVDSAGNSNRDGLEYRYLVIGV